MKISRRNALHSLLFGAGYVGLRSLATGIPAAVLTRGSRALADTPACANPGKAQYIIFNTSGNGDPINVNAPGTYIDGVVHNTDASMIGTTMTLGGQPTKAALPWTQLPPAVLARLAVWHIQTNNPIHPREPDVLRLFGATTPAEMLPSLLARQLAPCLHTIQPQPISIGASSPSEGLTFNGQALPILPPLALKATLTAPNGPLSNLQGLRDQTLGKLDTIYRGTADAAQAKYLDALVVSQSQLRNLNDNLLSLLSQIQDNDAPGQTLAALALIQMNVTPVVTVHIPFGGDNHHDPNLATEASETVSGLQAIGNLMSQIPANLVDQVTFMSLNVFGRTMGTGTDQGRQHNPNHQVSITIGKPFKPGIIGGLAAVGGDFGALPISSASGAGSASGDIATGDLLASFGKTMLAGVGIDPTVINSAVTSGTVVTGALT